MSRIQSKKTKEPYAYLGIGELVSTPLLKKICNLHI